MLLLGRGGGGLASGQCWSGVTGSESESEREEGREGGRERDRQRQRERERESERKTGIEREKVPGLEVRPINMLRLASQSFKLWTLEPETVFSPIILVSPMNSLRGISYSVLSIYCGAYVTA